MTEDELIAIRRHLSESTPVVGTLTLDDGTTQITLDDGTTVVTLD